MKKSLAHLPKQKQDEVELAGILTEQQKHAINSIPSVG